MVKSVLIGEQASPQTSQMSDGRGEAGNNMMGRKKDGKKDGWVGGVSGRRERESRLIGLAVGSIGPTILIQRRGGQSRSTEFTSGLIILSTFPL